MKQYSYVVNGRKVSSNNLPEAKCLAIQSILSDLVEPQVTPKYHLVVERETLSHLALKYYGDPDNYMKIYNANRGQIIVPWVIRPGMNLLIP